VTTPREQLIEAIAPRFCDMEPVHSACKQRAESVLQALSDLGAVVLMPVSLAELAGGESYILPGRYVKKPQDVGDMNARVWINALESDQS
jgi:hypothetical protein